MFSGWMWINLVLLFVSEVADISLPLEADGMYYVLPHIFRIFAFIGETGLSIHYFSIV